MNFIDRTKILTRSKSRPEGQLPCMQCSKPIYWRIQWDGTILATCSTPNCIIESIQCLPVN